MHKISWVFFCVKGAFINYHQGGHPVIESGPSLMGGSGFWWSSDGHFNETGSLYTAGLSISPQELGLEFVCKASLTTRM